MGSGPELVIGGRKVGVGYPPYVIAEAGVHHDNSLSLAKRLIEEARIAGADAVKFQTYQAGRIAARWAPTYWDSPDGQTQYDIFAERSLLTEDDYGALFEYAADLGIVLLSTPFDPDSAEMLAGFKMPAFKIASADLLYHHMLEQVASYGVPVLLSTGAARFEEVGRTVSLLRGLGADVGLLHCVLSYPTPVKDANLARITQLRERWPDLVVGYSDHTQPQDSTLACPLAVALGARVIETHFTLNKKLDHDDHYHAEDPAGLARLVRDCRDAFLMGAEGVEMAECEAPARSYARRSIVAAKPLRKGAVVRLEDLDFKRPGTGISPSEVQTVLGRTLRRDLAADELVRQDDLEPSGVNQKGVGQSAS